MVIRLAKQSDLKQIAIIFQQEIKKSPYNEEVDISSSIKQAKNYYKEHIIYVACEKGKVLGFVIGSKYYWLREWRLWISELFVTEDHRGKGIGKALMKNIEDHFRKEDVSIIELNSHSKAPAFKFYKSIGFKETGFVNLRKE